jgi:hypothetical protein
MVADQYANPIAGVAVTFGDGGVGGTFSDPGSIITDNAGMAADFYTLPAAQGPVSVFSLASGIPNPAVFSEIAQ